jgi:uncharacterized membrane protein YebE (DUF533 family)
MFDAKRLLDQFLGGQGMGGNDPRQQQGSGRGMLDMLGGGAAQSGSRQGGGLAGGIGGALGSVNDYARSNPLLAGALSGGLASVLMGSKGGRKLASNALTYGGIAVIGGLAYKAYRDYQAGQGGQQGAPAAAPVAGQPAGSGVPLIMPPSDSPFSIENAPQGADRLAQALLSAMIAAAKADGHVDDEEQRRILGKLSENGLDPDEVAFLTRELSAPLDIDKVVKGATTKEEAVELYAASLVAITADHPAERAYLDMLAARLGLEPALAKTVENTIEGVTVAA